MAVYEWDVIRVFGLKADMPTTLRNGQIGFCTDTLEIAAKTLSGGDMYYYG